MADEQQFTEDDSDFGFFSLVRLGAALLVILISILIRKTTVDLILNLLKTVTGWGEDKHKSAEGVLGGPINFVMVMGGIYAAGEIISLPRDLDELVGHTHRSFLLTIVFYTAYQAVPAFGYVLEQTSSGGVGKEIREVTTRLIQIIIAIVGVLSILQAWGVNVGAFLASLGLAGMAIALAAGDTMRNFFGTIVVLADDIFGINDWIKTPQAEGFVTHFGLRTTLLKGFDASQISIPNGVLADTTIINFSKCTQRQVTWTLPIVGPTNQSFVDVVDGFSEHLKSNKEVSKDKLIIVTIDNFGCACMEIFILFYTKETDWNKYMEVKQNVILEFNEIVTKAGCRFGVPTVAAVLA